MASCLHFCGLVNEGNHVSNHAGLAEGASANHALDTLVSDLQDINPQMGHPTYYNRNKKWRKTKNITLSKLCQEVDSLPKLVIPQGKDGSINHAVAVVDDLIFDSTQSHAMKLKKESFDWICGSHGVQDLFIVIDYERIGSFYTREPDIH